MPRNLSARFGEWATRLRDKFVDDPFFVAKIRLVLLCSALIFLLIIVNTTLDYYVLRPTIFEALDTASSLSPHDAFHQVETYILYTRVFRTAVFIIILYFLAGFVVRPLKMASDIQRRFIANVSHELKTPLAVKATTTEVALRKGGSLSRDELIAVLRKNLTETERLAAIVSYMIMLSDPKANHRAWHTDTVSLASVVKEAIALTEEKAKNKGVLLQTNLDQAVVLGKQVALVQLLTNLIDNAIGHAPTGSTVRVQTVSGDGGPTLSVEDEGRGIRKEDRRHIFEPFYRGTGAPLGGHGLGLSIVEGIVRGHGAKIRVEHLTPGTRFSVTFPRKAA